MVAHTRLFRAPADEVQNNWTLPDISAPSDSVAPSAIGRRPVSAPVEEGEEPLPKLPTLDEIEALRQDAYQEGLQQGQVKGHAEGVAQGLAEGRKTGQAEGYQQGLAKGLADGQAEIAARGAQWDSLLAELVSPLNAVDEQVERELVTLAMKLAQAVVQVELRTHPEAVLATLRQAIAALPSQKQQVAIHLNAKDLATVRDAFGEDALAQRDWQLVAEPSLSPGSLTVHTERSEVQMLEDARLRQVLESFAQRPRDPVVEPQYPSPAAVAPQTDSPAPEPQAEPAPEA